MNNNTNNTDNTIENKLNTTVIEALQTVFDPEFPVVDIYTLGLIYDVTIKEEEKQIFILMTLTSPACPVGDMIVEMVKNAILEKVQGYEVATEITFDPIWSPDMIKDEDLKRMFEV